MAAKARTFEWASNVASIIDGIGNDTLPFRVLSVLSNLVHFEHTGVFLFERERRPRDVLGRHLNGAFHRKYAGGNYRLDPFYKSSRHTPPVGGVFRMGELDPGYQRYLDDYEMGPRLADIGLPPPAAFPAGVPTGARLCEEIGYLLPMPDGRVIHIALIRSTALEPFDDDEISQLRQLAPVLQAAFGRHFRASDLAGLDEGIEAAEASGPPEPAAWHSGHITPREHDVAKGILDGLTSGEIARRLGIAAETVKVHRRNVYRKLAISSRSELARLLRHSLHRDDAEGQRDRKSLPGTPLCE